MPVYHVTVGDKTYTVEVPNPRERPVRAIVDGEVIEVSLQDVAGAQLEGAAMPAPTPSASVVSTPAAAPTTGSSDITAPLPGVVIAITAKVGDVVSPGQELCVLEAMKMNNPIRSMVSGVIQAVHVSVGQQVQHGAPLFSLS